MKYFFYVLVIGLGLTTLGQDYFPDSIQVKAPRTYAYYAAFISAGNNGDGTEALASLDSTIKYAQVELPGDYLVLTRLEFYKAMQLLNGYSIVESETYVRSLLETYESGERRNKYGEGRLLLALAAIEYTGLNYEKSIATSRKAISKTSDYTFLMGAYSNITRCFYILNESDSMILYAKKSIELMEENQDTASFDYLTLNLNLAHQLGTNGECVEALNRANRMSGKLEDYLSTTEVPPLNKGHNYMLLSYIHSNCGKYTKGLNYAKRAKLVVSGIKSAEKPYSYALDEIIRNYLQLENYDSAVHYIEQFLPLQKSHIILENSLLTEAEKDVYLNRKNNGQQYALTLLEEGHCDPHYNELVYTHTVFLKSFTLHSLRNLQTALYAEADTAIRKSFNEWLSLRERYYQNLRFADDTDLNLDSIKYQINKLEKDFYRVTNLNSQNKLLKNFEWQKIKNTLEKEDLVIDFVRYQNFKYDNQWRYGAFIIHTESEFPEYLSLCSEVELENVLSRKQFESEFRYINRIYGSASQLYKLIWSKILSKYDQKRRIYASCVGLLHGLSHDAILTSKNEEGLEQPEIILMNSIAHLPDLERASIFKDDLEVMLLGGIDYDLPLNTNQIFEDTMTIHSENRGRIAGNWTTLVHTQTEVERINKMIQKRGGYTTFFSGWEASETKFKKSVENTIPDIIHFATHGYFLNDTNKTISPSQAANYTQSGMVMAGANACYESQASIGGYGDGILTAPEISSLDLSKTKLVVLSACQTGLGDLNNIGNAYGLQRAFKIAGADYIIYSLWKVSDEVTLKFMTIFYKKLLNNSTIQEAFYATQREIKANYSTFYWAPFQLIN